MLILAEYIDTKCIQRYISSVIQATGHSTATGEMWVVQQYTVKICKEKAIVVLSIDNRFKTIDYTTTTTCVIIIIIIIITILIMMMDDLY